MNFEQKYLKYKKKYSELKKSNDSSMTGGSSPFKVIVGERMEDDNEFLYYPTKEGIVLHTSNTNGPIELKRGRTQLYSSDMNDILKGTRIMYLNGKMIWINKADQSFDSLIKSDLIDSIQLRYNGSVEKPIKDEIHKMSNTRLDQYYTKIMIIINFKLEVTKEYLLNTYHLFNVVGEEDVEFYNNDKSVNFERNVSLDLFGKTLFVEPTSSNEIKKTLEELKQQITDKKKEENTVLDRINNTINNIQKFNLDQYKKLPVEYNNLSYVEKDN
jgi:hypothetical protein